MRYEIEKKNVLYFLLIMLIIADKQQLDFFLNIIDFLSMLFFLQYFLFIFPKYYIKYLKMTSFVILFISDAFYFTI